MFWQNGCRHPVTLAVMAIALGVQAGCGQASDPTSSEVGGGRTAGPGKPVGASALSHGNTSREPETGSNLGKMKTGLAGSASSVAGDGAAGDSPAATEARANTSPAATKHGAVPDGTKR